MARNLLRNKSKKKVIIHTIRDVNGKARFIFQNIITANKIRGRTALKLHSILERKHAYLKEPRSKRDKQQNQFPFRN